ncbi:MAG: prolipoprotein diacylglyceryl transferase [Candidatus Marinimicrobia bacterium]|jgi:phosphatidylglycerol:prolipoprotein diacylglycerol transferase|nr:prolipoprotein diacylglyceryl transferase [Candidatus Neomarinimicrobiota bacterium]
MWPIIFDFGELNVFGFEFHPVINSYGFMLMMAFYSCYYFLNKDLKEMGYDSKLAADIVFAAAVGGILGSKIYYLIENLDRVIADPTGMIFSGAGLVFLGGLMGGTLGVTWVLKKNKLQWFKFADVVAPLLMLGYAIGRVGCLLVGDDYGKPTHLPWGISFPDGLPPSTYRVFQTYYPWINLEGFDPGVLTVHPTQIYETILGLGIFYFLYQKRKTVTVAGSLFFTYLIFAGSERFVIEFFRVNIKYLFGLSGSQLISICMIGIGAWFLTNPVKSSTAASSE